MTLIVTNAVLRKLKIRDQLVTAIGIWQENYYPKVKVKIVLGTF